MCRCDFGSLVLGSQIPLRRFSLEEVSTWSALSCPRVVELFGAVREGPTIVLFMDLKPGKSSLTAQKKLFSFIFGPLKFAVTRQRV